MSLHRIIRFLFVASEFIDKPVLASAKYGQFPNYETMPDGLKWLLSYYELSLQSHCSRTRSRCG